MGREGGRVCVCAYQSIGHGLGTLLEVHVVRVVSSGREHSHHWVQGEEEALASP